MREKESNNKFISLISFVLSFVFIIGMSAIRFFVLEKEMSLSTSILVFAINMIAMGLIIIGYAVYVFNARKSLTRFPKNIAVIMATITITYSINVILTVFDYYYVFIALTAFVLAPLSNKKDVFMASLITAIMTFVTLFVSTTFHNSAVLSDPAVTTEQILMVTQRLMTDHVELVLIFVIEVLISSIAGVWLSESYNRITYILIGALLESVALGFQVSINYFVLKQPMFEDVLLTIGCAYLPILLSQMLQPLFESIFNILSNAKLHELTDNNAPLIKKMNAEAPGTFNHCLAVASYAEMCAVAIGENPHLAKACAYYHDVGKTENPRYFSENQGEENPHDALLPERSAEIVRKHTTDGYELCEKYHIPAEIRDVTIQHHGTLPMAVFYFKAKKLTDSDVDENDYIYHGVTPESKIAAILMICDAAEAAIRSKGKPTAEEVSKLIGSIIADRIAKKQFDNCDITLKDLDIIKDTIVEVYGGVVHKRVKYPKGE